MGESELNKAGRNSSSFSLLSYCKYCVNINIIAVAGAGTDFSDVVKSTRLFQEANPHRFVR